MLINLLSNAVKFTERGRVAVRASFPPGRAETGTSSTIAVEDTGPGIEPENLTRIFDAFDQADSTVRIGGTGLGLTISRELRAPDAAETSSSRARPGQGSVFTFSFEAAAAALEPVPERRRASDSDRARTGSARRGRC